MKRFIANYKYYIFFLIASLSMCFVMFSQAGSVPLSPALIPRPHELRLTGKDASIDKRWVIAVDAGDKENLFTAQLLKSKLDNKLAIADIHSALASPCIMLDSRGGDTAEKNEQGGADRCGSEGYRLEVSPSLIKVSANTSTGVFYGVQTLFQLMRKQGNEIIVPGVSILDYPDRGLRGVHFLGLEGSVEEMKDKLDFLASIKINTAVFSEHAFWNLEKDTLVPGRTNSSVLKELFAYARERHIEPVPELQSFGIALTILQKDPHAGEGVWVRDEPFKWVNNMAVPVHSQEVSLENPGFEIGGAGGVPGGWDVGNENGRTDWHRDKTTAYSGRCSVMLHVPASLSRSSNTLQSRRRIAVDPDTVYTLSFYAKKREINAGVDTGFAVRVSQFDREEHLLVNNYMPLQSANTSWGKLELNFVTRPDTAQIRIGASSIDSWGTAWLDDFKLKRMNGVLVNVIRTDASNIVITDLAKSKIYEEGKDYIVLNGELQHAYVVNEERPTRIKRLETGQIGDKESVLISYDFIVRFHPATWMTPYCPSEPRTYKIFFAVLRDVIKVLHPRYINIGHDDIYGMCRDSRCRKRNMAIDALLAEDVNTLHDYVQSIDPNVRLMIWDDMFNPWHTGGIDNFQMNYGGAPGKTAGAIDMISKDVILMSWWYDARDLQQKMKKTPGFLKSKGFDYLVAGWKKKSIEYWSEIIKEEKECMGLMVTTWDGWSNNIDGVESTANLGWFSE